MNDSTSIGKRLQNLEIGDEFDSYTRVILHVGQVTDAQGNTTDLDYIAGNETGRTLEVSDPFGTQEKANAMLARLQNSKFQYQPARMDKALLDPAAELGDGISASDIFTAIYKRKVVFSSLMAADVEAPSEEEIDHEYPYITQTDRKWKRETAYTRTQLRLNENEIVAEASRATSAEGALSSRITINATAITSEVSRATAAEGTLSSRITQNATDIAARVLKKSGTNTVGFGWDLNDSSWKVGPYNGGSLKPVLTIDKNGLTVKGSGEFSGTITATGGTIGGITLNKDVGLYTNGKTSATSTASGFLIHKNGAIYLGAYSSTYGACPFQVTASGVLTANSGTIGGISLNRSYGLYTNGKTSATSTANGFLISNNGGIYIGPYDSSAGACKFQVTSTGAVTASNLKINGGTIKIGSNFNVDSSGNVTANNMTLSGTLTVGGRSITAANLRQGAERANSGYSTWNGTTNTVNAGASGWNSAKTNWDNAMNSNVGVNYLRASTVYGSSAVIANNLYIGQSKLSLRTAKDGNGNTIAFVGWGYE